MRGVFLDIQTLAPADLDLAALTKCLSHFVNYDYSTPEQVVDRLLDADIALVNKVVLSAEVLSKLPKLRHIQVAATGVNNIDIEAAKALNITVQNCQAYGIDSVAQHTLMLILALSHRLLDYHQAVKQGQWSHAKQFCMLDYSINCLAGKTLGIIGYGHLGQAVAKLAKVFGMHILIAGRRGAPCPAGRVPLDDMLPQVDVLSMHCPLTSATHNLINMDVMRQMRPTALLINCARGGIVNEQDLLSALTQQEIAGAALDVLIQEPPAPNHPLLHYPGNNLIITPHSAWGSREARQTIVDQLAANIESLKPNFIKPSAPQFMLT